MRNRWRALLPLVLLALALLARPANRADAELAAPAEPLPDIRAVQLFLNSRETASLFGPAGLSMYRFDPVDGGEYRFVTFASSPGQQVDVAARLYRAGYDQPVAAAGGAGQLRLDATLQAGQSYFLVLQGAADGDQGDVAVEVMRLAHGRNIDQPIGLTGGARYTKAIATPRDAHWYSFTAPKSGMYAIRSESAQNPPLDTQAYLLDEDGVALVYSDDVLFPGDPNFAMWAQLTAGRTYRVRVNAFSNLTGAYRLVLVTPGDAQLPPASIALSHSAATLPLGEELRLTAAAQPDNANSDIAWASSNYAVASVTPDGVVEAIAPGRARIVAIGYGGVQAECLVDVPPIEATSIAFTEEDIALPAEGLHALTVRLTPGNATPQALTYASNDPAVATINANGVVTGISPGEAYVTVRSPGGLTASVHVTVTRRAPAYRALVMGEQNYLDGRTRVGAVNTAQGVADMLSLLGGEGGQNGGYQVTLKLDSTLPQLTDSIAAAFDGARPGDVSLFYINCHGRYESGTAYIELHDGNRVTAGQLADMLGGIPGEVVVMIDCCQSGGFIAAAGEPGSFGAATEAAFSGRGGTPFTTGRFKVVASTGENQDSYRITSDGERTEAGMATVFGRSLCEAGGWDLLRDRRISMKADLDRDLTVTFQELFAYVRNRVNYRMRAAGVRQTVQAFPIGDQLALFTRPEAAP
ncbi:MAG: hypothetical protein GX558_02465 [Clostridiales bacterium]|nr:hypothetical protein [Clostridiales bacterium]